MAFVVPGRCGAHQLLEMDVRVRMVANLALLSKFTERIFTGNLVSIFSDGLAKILAVTSLFGARALRLLHRIRQLRVCSMLRRLTNVNLLRQR